MRSPHSAGILLFRRTGAELEVLLIRPGGPYWRNKDVGAWMIPKGTIEADELPLAAALREFAEETGTVVTAPTFPLGRIRQAGGKVVEAFAAEGDLDAANVQSAEFEMEWPPQSGAIRRFPEAEEARWMSLGEARAIMLPSQLPLLDALESNLKGQ
ncbi:MAG: NUDIX domain-containing protein [Sphingomicrobium sp.]|jgi:predicted NUDIX family NTP pyrophosphohydrolase